MDICILIEEKNAMKILFSGEVFYPFVGGGSISMYTLLKELAKDHEVHAVCSGSGYEEFKLDGIFIHRVKVMSMHPGWLRFLTMNKYWEKVLSKIVKKVKPDILLTQLGLAPASVKVAKRYNVKSIFFIRDLRHICPILFLNRDISSCDGFCWRCINLKWKIQYVLLKIGMKAHEKALKDADVVIANSKCVAGVVKKKYGVDCEVIYPFINLNEYKVEKLEPKYVTFFNPSIHKGGKIVLEIAKQMKNIKFLVRGRGNVDFGKLPNVTQISWVRDVRKVYSKTKILLVPSLAPEAFGRVAVEAMINLSLIHI